MARPIPPSAATCAPGSGSGATCVVAGAATSDAVIDGIDSHQALAIPLTADPSGSEHDPLIGSMLR